MNLFTKIFFIIFLSFSILISCDNQKAGTFAVKFSWASDGEGKEIKPDVSTGEFFVTVRIYEWKEGITFPGDIAANGKQLIQSDSAQMKATGTSIDFGDLSYGSRRFVVAEIRKGEELTNSVLFTGMSQLFELKAGKHTEVNVEMSLTGLPGYDENGNNTFKIWVFHKDSPADRVPESRVALRFTVINANSVIIANDLNFEKGTAEIALTDLKKIDETTYEYSPWDFTTGWEEIGDGTYTVFGKLKNNIGQIGEPKRADVFLDTTPPVPNITPFKEVAKLGDRIEVRVLFDEAVDPESLIPGWQGLPFVLEENKEDKSFVYTYTVQEEDNEIEYQFSLTAADVVGNKTDVVDLGKVRIDTTPPDLNYIAMFKNGTEHGLSSNLYLKHGDILRFELELNEEITEIPQLLLGPHKIICEEGEKELSFDCSLTIDKDVTYDVVADISLSFNDIAGNIYSRSIVSGAKIDTQVPQFIFRKNKDPQDYNATDTIVLTITANEPVSMIEVNGTELDNTLTSWNISGKNETGTHEVKLKAVDLAGNEQTEFTVGTYKVDADYPSAVISNPAPVRISGTGSSVITVNGFNKPIASVKLNGTECTGEGARTCTFNAPAGSGDSIESLTVTLTDFAGNISNISAGTVYVDRTAPEVSGDATVIFTKPAGCPLSSVSSITSGSSVDISFIVNEPLQELGDPLVSAHGDVNIIDFNITGQIGYFYTFSKSDINTEFLTDGTYIFKIEIEDEVGNKNNITLTGGFEIDTAKPDAPFVNEEERIVYRRIPWGSDETGGVKYFGLKATGNAVDENTSWVYAYDGSDPATASEIGKTAASGGTFSEFELNRADRTEVYLAAYDNACNRSDVVKVLDVEWVATMGGKVPGSTWENPHVFVTSNLIEPQLIQKSNLSNEPENAGTILTTRTGNGFWSLLSKDIDAPSVRESSAMTYNPVEGKVLLFGGHYNLNGVDFYYNDTWEWNGYVWTLLNPANRPPAGENFIMTFDSSRGEALLILNNFEIWVWNGVNWSKKISSHFPSIQYGYNVVYDSARGRVVLFGGFSETYSNETWEWNGTDWLLREPLNKPSGRENAMMAYDSLRRKTVLFGGYPNNNETWEWDGENWTLLNPLTKPPDSYYPHRAMAFDSDSNRTILFMFDLSYYEKHIEAWAWDGENWSYLGTDHSTVPREKCPMVYDSIHKNMILFGGHIIASPPYRNDTLGWFNNLWHNFNYQPSARSGHAMAYDSIRNEAVLFGGGDDQTWIWNGKNWQQKTPSQKPSARSYHSMSYDRKSGKILLFGGKSVSDGWVNDTWEWDGENWIQRSGESCLGSSCYVCSLESCPDKNQGSVSYDEIREVTTLFAVNETWVWDGNVWIKKEPLTDPGEHTEAATAYDSSLNRTILFGGTSSSTWAWDGNNWSFMQDEEGMSGARWYNTLTYDRTREETLLFGGVYSFEGSNYFFNDFVKWSETGWQQIPVSDLPEARYSHAIAHDEISGKSVLFGGETFNGSSSETWFWNGGGKDRPGQIINIAYEKSGITEKSQIQSVNVFFNAGGLGDYSGTPHEGVDLLTWKHDRWITVASNEAGPDALEPVTWETTDPVEIQTLLNSGLRKFNFAVVPTAPNGTLTDMGSIATDYAEVVVRYTITD
jgi:hypothetical protein